MSEHRRTSGLASGATWTLGPINDSSDVARREMPLKNESSERLRAFAYVNVEHTALYRGVMRCFMEAKERFSLHLKVADVYATLDASLGVGNDVPSVEGALQQLCEWGNLEKHPDTADVTTVEEFYRPRFLYQLTPVGEAAERAINRFEEDVHRPGELQAAALGDIRALLEELVAVGSERDLDDARVHRTLSQLRLRFDELTSRAQAFIGSLQRPIDLQSAAIADFLSYKDTLINYLERFIGELRLATADIARLIQRIEREDVARLLAAAARRDLSDAIAATDDDLRAAERRWDLRWSGLRAWFLGAAGMQSQAEVLRSRARSAIPSLLSVLGTINDRRMTRSDRVADFRTLARWFAEIDRESDLHRLWRAAFALTPSRHLRIDGPTLDERDAAPPISAQTSWMDAPPLRIAPRLRELGHHAHHGRPANVVDHTADKALLRQEAEAQAAQIAAAHLRLATGHRTRLSEFSQLDPIEFDLLLDLLGEALTWRGPAGELVQVASSDGAFRITLEPTNDGSIATIRTVLGDLTGPDHWITIEDAFDTVAAGSLTS